MKIVKVSCFEYDPERWGSFRRQSPGGNCIWGNYKFVFNEDIDECDYWIVYDQIPKTETCKCPKKNTLFITGEPPHIGAYPVSFLNQFHNIVTCDWKLSRSQLSKYNATDYIQGLPWIINKTYDELVSMKEIKKPKLMSLITSKKDKKRYDAAVILKEHFGDQLDLYGDGINSVKDKWDALAPYKYSIVMENEKVSDYFTEKLTDCYLAKTYPFYYGCKNLGYKEWRNARPHEYFDYSAFTEIDINDMETTIDKIEFELSANNYNQSKLEEPRNKCLNYYNFYPLVIRLIESNPWSYDHSCENKTEITISDKDRFIKDKLMFLKKLRWSVSQWLV